MQILVDTGLPVGRCFLNSICETSAKINGMIPIFAKIKYILFKTVNENFRIYYKPLMKSCKQIESRHNKLQIKLLSRMYTVTYRQLLGNSSINTFPLRILGKQPIAR